jgi:TRAP transporter 4TM/12TM fusion protein
MRDLKWLNRIIAIFAICLSVFHIYSSLVGGHDPLKFRFTHVTFFTILGALVLFRQDLRAKKRIFLYLDIALILGAGIVYGYFLVNYSRIFFHIPFMNVPPQTDVVMCCILVGMVLIAAWRHIGWLLPVVSLVFFLYGVFGGHLSGALKHTGISFESMVDYLGFTTNGIFGSAIDTSSHYLILFVIFGAFLTVTGVGEYFTRLATSLAGGTRGGPAKVAVLSSALVGSITGSAAANVMTTGVFTIPLMKKSGFSSNFAGAVEAAASTGGAMLPPVMGSAAFLMADILGIPYLQVAKASLIPAILYYIAILFIVDLEAVKQGIRGMDRSELPSRRSVLLDLYNLLPFVVIIVTLFSGYSAAYACLLGIASCIVIGVINFKKGGLTLARFFEALEKGSTNAVKIVSACACAGIIVGMVSLTGLGGKFTSMMLSVSGGIELLVLVFIMISAIILGMGMTISPAYIMAGVLGAPILLKMGFAPIAAHLFILYFAALAPLTPPVALAAYAAAGIAEGDMNKTGWQGLRLALVGFIIPYVFIYNNQLLLEGAVGDVFLSVITALVGIVWFAFGISGNVFRSRLFMWQRVAMIAAGLLMIVPGLLTDISGVVLGIGVWFFTVKGKNMIVTPKQG